MDANNQMQTSSRRGQWQKIKTLPEEVIVELETNLCENHFSLEVRDFLADWIENHEWSSVDEGTAKACLSKMIFVIKDCADNENFSIQRNLKKAAEKIEEHYENSPVKFMENMEKILLKEQELLQKHGEKDNDLIQQVNQTNNLIEICEILLQKIQQKIEYINLNLVNNMDLYSPYTEIGKKLQEQYLEELPSLFENLYCCLKNIQEKILNEDLKNWITNQKLHGNKTEEINEIQTWCSRIALLIHASQQQISQINHLVDMNKLSFFLTELNFELIQRTFIVLVQPPRILKVNTNMKASVCLLLAEAMNITSKSVTVTAELISNDEVKGILQNNTSTMKISQKQNIAEFTKMKVNDVTRSKNKSGESVTDEKFVLKFFMQIEIEGIKLNLQVFSFPVVVIQHGNQECRAMATILWDNCFDENTVPWPKFADMLEYRFTETIGVSLTPQDFEYFASKIFDKKVNDLSTMSITWTQFCKMNMNDKKFSFWDWFYAIEKLIQNFFVDMFKDKLIIGFVSKKQAKDMLNQTHPGTFLLRFSNNCLGGISIAVKDSKSIKHLSPFKIEELKKHSLVKLIQKQKSLLYLYPNRPKSDAFQKYLITKEDPDETLQNQGYVKRDFNLIYESDADEEQTNFNALMNTIHDEMDFETSTFNCLDFTLPPLTKELPLDIFNE